MCKKIECPICKEKKRLKCFIFNSVKNEKICRKCNRKIGNNIFYIPYKERKKNFIGRFNISNEERRRLYSNFIRQGLTPEQASRRIAYTIKCLRGNKYRKKGLETIKRNRELKAKQEREQMKKKFIGGLK